MSKLQITLWGIFLGLSAGWSSAAIGEESLGSVVPSSFANPPAMFRPLQIVHGLDGLAASQYPNRPFDSAFIAELAHASTHLPPNTPDLKSALKNSFQELVDSGLGGVVCNDSFSDYLVDQDQWTLFALGMEACRELNLRVWIYDERGYPSGSAGGLVLEKNPALEAQELILDPTSDKKFRIRPSYEGTHACNNFHEARRYINLLDRDADNAFIQVTHDAYAKICSADFGKMIEAFFTDEPSMMACNLGQLSEEVRKNVPVRDPLDPTVTRQPAVPWVHDLPELFQQKYGYDITEKVGSLFAGSSDSDKKVRREFWALVSELLETRFFGALEKWCGEHNLASSGHVLWEESLLFHPALNGNALRNLQRMQIPGIDILSSNPGNAFGGYTVTASLAASAAKLNGTRRVMTEVSDFSEQMSAQKRSATLDEMRATAAWQFALGVTDFTLYYSRNRSGDDYKRYCDYVGRLGFLLAPAKRVTRIALYYPIYDLWTWYRPEAEKPSLDKQPEIVKTIVQSFSDVTSEMVRDGASFCYVDHNHLQQAQIKGKQLSLPKVNFDALVIPAVDEIPAGAQKTIDAFQAAGGTVIRTTNNSDWKTQLKPFQIAEVTPKQPGCLWSEFEKGDSKILLFVNTTNSAWDGTVKLPPFKEITQWNFSTGAIEPLAKDSAEKSVIDLHLKPYESIALVWNL